jgi:hypothetical protein
MALGHPGSAGPPVGYPAPQAAHDQEATRVRIDSFERQLLRDRALDRWQLSKAARHDAATSARYAETRARSDALRRQADAVHERAGEAIARAARLVQEVTILRGSSVNNSTLELLADRAIRSWRSHGRDEADPAGGVALAASARMSALIHVKHLLGTRVNRVAGASDAGTALGLVIVTQPDLAIIDESLELAKGTDLAVVLPLYAPQTRALVLTDDPARSRELRAIGFDVEGVDADDDSLLDWVERAA